MATVITSDNVQVTLTPTFISNCPAIKDMMSDLGMSCNPLGMSYNPLGGNTEAFPIQIDSETIQEFSDVFDKLATCDGSEQSVADMDKWLSDWADFKTPADHFDILKYKKYVEASSHLTGNSENQYKPDDAEPNEKPKPTCGAKKLTKMFGKKMCDFVAFKTPEQIREAANICSSCYRVPCLNPTILRETQKEVNMDLKIVEVVQVDVPHPCQDCDACKAVYCRHDKILNHMSKEEEELPIPRYEEWKIKMDIMEEYNAKSKTSTKDD